MTDYDRAVAMWRGRGIKGAAELAETLNAQCVSFAYHSGKLENENVTYGDTREIFDHDGVSAYTGDLRTLFEIRNARDAHELFLDAFESGRPLDESLVLEFHKKLMLNTYDARRWQLGERPGEYKLHDYVTGKMEIGSSPENAAADMAALLDELNGTEYRDDRQILTAAAYFHARFENIHPFADGNGRTGRLAMNYFLVLHRHPPVTIHEEDRGGYYAALEAWDEAQDLNPLLSFLTAQTAKTWAKHVARHSCP